MRHIRYVLIAFVAAGTGLLAGACGSPETTINAALNTYETQEALPAAQGASSGEDAVGALAALLMDEADAAYATTGGDAPVSDERLSPFLASLDADVGGLSSPATLEEVHAEVLELRSEVKRLTQSLEKYHETFVSELEHENALLREELSRLYAQSPPEVFLPNVPRPGGELYQELAQTAPEVAVEMAPTMPQLELVPPEGELQYSILDEWGRSAEQSKRLGENVASLQGMIVVVPPGADDEQLKALGQRLRQQYADRDNLDLRVFDDEALAQQHLADSSAAQPILKITRSRSTKEDIILRIKDGNSYEIWSAE